MFPVSRPKRRQHGFTLLEAMVGLTVIGVLLALGVPAMSSWVQSAKARTAVDFYGEGFALARQQAVSHNGASRIVLTPNLSNGQNDWQVDICFPTSAAPCNDNTGAWSTTTAPAAGDPEKANGFKSVSRLANTLPKSTVLSPQMLPAGATTVYFNSLGWVDSAVPQRMTMLRFTPGFGYEDQLRPAALVIGLAGTATKCDWSVAVPDSRACPP